MFINQIRQRTNSLLETIHLPLPQAETLVKLNMNFKNTPFNMSNVVVTITLLGDELVVSRERDGVTFIIDRHCIDNFSGSEVLNKFGKIIETYVSIEIKLLVLAVNDMGKVYGITGRSEEEEKKLINLAQTDIINFSRTLRITGILDKMTVNETLACNLHYDGVDDSLNMVYFNPTAEDPIDTYEYMGRIMKFTNELENNPKILSYFRENVYLPAELSLIHIEQYERDTLAVFNRAKEAFHSTKDEVVIAQNHRNQVLTYIGSTRSFMFATSSDNQNHYYYKIPITNPRDPSPEIKAVVRKFMSLGNLSSD